MSVRILIGDALEQLRTLPDASVQCCVTSPPYYGLRDYGNDGQIGLEETPDEYVANLADVFREVRRVLKDDGTLWLNLGDSYAGSGNGQQGSTGQCAYRSAARNKVRELPSRKVGVGLKPKDLMMIPEAVAIALRADGWWLRDKIVWAKPNPMPSSVKDRCTPAWESVFLLAKSKQYFFDADAIAEEATGRASGNGFERDHRISIGGRGQSNEWEGSDKRNARNVWTISSESCSEAHFAVMPTELAKRCVLAGSRPGDTVLDPFGGAGTTGLAADRLQRDAILIELNPDYVEIAKRRIYSEAPLLAVVA